jgi:hypothetical protein
MVTGRPLVGAMTWSGKARDLLRNPRYLLHSVVTGADSGEGELKFYGFAVEANPDLRGRRMRGGRRTRRKRRSYSRCVLGKSCSSLDIEHGVMTVH